MVGARGSADHVEIVPRRPRPPCPGCLIEAEALHPALQRVRGAPLFEHGRTCGRVLAARQISFPSSRRLEHDVRVRVRETRHGRRAAEVDAAGARARGGDGVERAGCFDVLSKHIDGATASRERVFVLIVPLNNSRAVEAASATIGIAALVLLIFDDENHLDAMPPGLLHADNAAQRTKWLRTWPESRLASDNP